MSEAEMQQGIIDTARWHGWRVHHDPPVRQERGGKVIHRTAYQGDPGFPDLVLARDGEVIIIECKSAHGGYRPGQREWAEALRSRIVRPRDYEAVLRRLAVPRPGGG